MRVLFLLGYVKHNQYIIIFQRVITYYRFNMADVTSAFDAHSLSVFDLFSKPGQFLYVPSYQRKYSWGKDKTTKFLNDILNGFGKLLKDQESYTFLGSIITVAGIDNESIYPRVDAHKPSNVISVIDGQQRTTTLLIVATVLHNMLAMKGRAFSSEEFEENNPGVNLWLEDSTNVVGQLSQLYEEDQKFGDKDPVFTYYPRMIRSFEDCWSKRKKDALYDSAIANLLHSYGKHSRSERKDQKIVFENGNNENIKSTLDAFKNIFDQIQRNIKQSITGDEDSFDIPTFEELRKDKKLQELLLKSSFTEDVEKYLDINDSRGELKEYILLLMISNYFTNYVALTVVTAKDEKYAFDIFESLNTTGEPLTAFETFKPKVIQDIGITEYYNEDSDLKSYLDEIESVLEENNNERIKKAKTSNLVITYASLWSHEKMSKKLSDQRQFFKNNYDSLNKGIESSDVRFQFVKYLSLTNEFISKIWSGEKDNYQDTYFDVNRKIDDHTNLSLAYLRELDHTIVIPILARFYIEFAVRSDFKNAIGEDYKDTDQIIDNFESAVKAIVSFSTLWRSSRKGTAGIDNVYRHLMSNNIDALNYKALSLTDTIIDRNSKEYFDSDVLDVAKLKLALRFYLKNDKKFPVVNKKQWVDRASKLAIYEEPNCITRLLLLAAAHNCVIDPSGELKKSAKNKVQEFLNYSNWKNLDLKTIEHILPQKLNKEDLKVIKLDDERDLHLLGNLTLLPQSANSIVGNKSWSEKYKIFQLLTATDADVIEDILKELETNKVITQNQIDTLRNWDYLPILKYVVDQGFKTIDSEIIHQRSKSIAGLACDELIKWLD